MNVEHILENKGREVCTITPEATVSDALHRMRNEKVGALVVSADGARIAGIVSDRGIMWALANHGTEVLAASVGSVMTEKVFTCSREDRVAQAHGGEVSVCSEPGQGSVFEVWLPLTHPVTCQPQPAGDP